MNKERLWNRDFTLVVLGQIISLFANAIVRTMLPLHILQLTQSPMLYGAVLASSTVPMIILSPVGGILADRLNKKKIMYILDFSTAILIGLLLFSMGKLNFVVTSIITIIILYGVQGLYQPTVQASIPLLASGENLITANAVVNQVGSLAGLIGPVIGGVVYGFWGIKSILVIVAICLLFSAIEETFIRIPYEKRQSEEGIFRRFKGDIQESLSFIKKDEPVILKIMFIVAAFNCVFSAMLLVGMPVLITQILHYSGSMYGYAQGTMMAGGIVGGVIIGIYAKKIKFKNAYRFLYFAALSILPMALAMLLKLPENVCYFAIVGSSFLLMCFITMFSVEMMALIQGKTPMHLTGKVISCVLTLSMCAQPLGQVIYGGLFGALRDKTYYILFGVIVVAIVISRFAKKIFQKL